MNTLYRLSLIFTITLGIIYYDYKQSAIDRLQPITITGHYIVQPIIKVSKPKETSVGCLQKTLYFEAANQGVEGMTAVANVVMNRVHHPAYPKSVCAVVHQGLHDKAGNLIFNKCQFKFYCDGKAHRVHPEQAWAQAGTIAKAAVKGDVDDIVQDAIYYHASYVSPSWASEKEPIAEIGNHIFYR